ncbi:MAG: hypothetical protein HYV27_03320 [Candidatus Hydrogenedentes bacterium]|nr:hypothetical protein [Candidatus Hydrogenedentota bacterium]
MPRIVKQVHSFRRSVDSFRLGADLEFPDLQAQGMAPDEPENDTDAEEEPIDPETIRLAIMEEAREVAAQKVQEAYAEGLSRGEQAGRDAFDASIAQAAAMLEDASQKIQQARAAYLDALTPQVSALAVLLAEQVIQKEVAQDAGHIHRTVRRALECLSDRQTITVHIHPADFAALTEHRVRLLEDFTGVEELNIEADETVEPGGCIIASQSTQVDATLRTLLAGIVERMYDA